MNLGYVLNMLGDGKVLYCPCFTANNKRSIFSFSTPRFMSTDNPQGVVKSTILFNPRVVNPGGYTGNKSNPPTRRRYQKTGDIQGGKLFAVDFMEGTGGMKFNADEFAHFPSKGWVTLFADGAARFVNSPAAFAIATAPNFTTVQSQLSCVQYDNIFNELENAQ